MLKLLQELWQENLVFLDLSAEFDDKNTLDLAEIAIILTVNSENYEKYIALKEFQNIFKKIHLRVDIYGIELAQVCSLNLLMKSYISKSDLIKALSILNAINDNSILLTFLENLELGQIDRKEQVLNSFSGLNHINAELCALCDDEGTQDKLRLMADKFSKLDFIIAVTGVMNSGKSSMLNALLKKDFLGVSNIPETANLTLLKYGENNKAKIYFWSIKEWENILASSKFSAEMKQFVTELSSKLDIQSYIKEDSLSEEIDLLELKNFTSAKNQISALIKKIEINASLEFLKNNICIVDTPGLDDVMVQREIVTNEYIKESDFLIHLMNVSQSLTQKDTEFLLDCLLNSRVSKLLVVLTKADLLNSKDLDEVIDYTKQTLKSRLKALEFDENFIQKIDFLSISAKKASDFYQGVADESSLKESGVLELENYLFNELYSGAKVALALEAYKKELNLEITHLITKYHLQNQAFNTLKHQLNAQNQELFLNYEKEKKNLEEAKKDTAQLVAKLSTNGANDVKVLMILLAKKLKERLIDELKYTNSKKQKMNLSRLMSIVDITVKDGINDVLREIKFENFKNIESTKEALSAKYAFLKDDFDNGFEEFKTKLSKSIENIFADDKYALFKLEIQKILEDDKDIFTLEPKLEKFINLSFENFKIDEILKELNINSQFLEFLNSKMSFYEQEQEQKMAYFNELLNNTQAKDANAFEKYEKNLEKIKCLEALRMDLINAN
ncbi:dynamin family protein [Campylobacter sp. US33a]|uniref:dynamin family protein n=1 Tax=Campylobacter sp. US33a TaxID=2498120 RepID=UPI0010678A42|nr:dynamin family protein [Campylobacter sp. US33a]TEY02701.1 ATP-binding protein [Campylobacter sp. US33a]